MDVTVLTWSALSTLAGSALDLAAGSPCRTSGQRVPRVDLSLAASPFPLPGVSRVSHFPEASAALQSDPPGQGLKWLLAVALLPLVGPAPFPLLSEGVGLMSQAAPLTGLEREDVLSASQLSRTLTPASPQETSSQDSLYSSLYSRGAVEGQESSPAPDCVPRELSTGSVHTHFGVPAL